MGDFNFSSIEEAIEDIRQGEFVIVVDDEDRENEGDFIIAAEYADPDKINFLTKEARGLICVAMEKERLDELNLHPMVSKNTSRLETAFTVSVDSKEGTTTGISAYDRSKTIRDLLDPATHPEDLSKPGHVFPLQAVEGGVLHRAGHTEAAVDLARLADCYPAGVLCEIMDEDGTMARFDSLKNIAKKFDVKMISIADLIEYRRRNENLIERGNEVHFPTDYGEFKLIPYKDEVSDITHLALVKGDVDGKEDVLVRVHSECLTGDIFGSLRCDCGDQLHASLYTIEEKGQGVLVYMRQEGRGIGLSDKLKAYHLQDLGMDTVEANCRLGYSPDLRDYGVGAQILCDLGLSTIKIMTNNPKKIIGLEGYGLTIVERVPIQAEPQDENINYLKAKRDKLGHIIELDNQEE